MSDVLLKQAKTIRQTITCCEYWYSSIPCDEECDKPFVWLEVAEQLEGRLKQARQLLDETRRWKIEFVYKSQRDGFLKWRERLLGVLSGQDKEILNNENKM